MQIDSHVFIISVQKELFTKSWVNENKSVFVSFASTSDSSEEMWRQIQQQLQNHSDSAEEFTQVFRDMSDVFHQDTVGIVAIWTQSDRLVAVTHNARVWLKRAEKFGNLLQSSNELKIIQGQIKIDDVFVLYANAVDPGLEKMLSEICKKPLTADEIVSEIEATLEVRSGENVREAGLVLTISGDKEAVVTEIQNASDGIISTDGNKPRIQFKLPSFSRGFLLSIKKIGKIVVLGLIVIAILFAVFWAIGKMQVRSTRGFIAPFESRLQTIQDQIPSDKLKARDEALKLLNDWESAKNTYTARGQSQNLVEAFQVQVETLYNDLSGRKSYSVLPVFYDFRLVRSDFVASYADMDGNLGMFLDPSKSSLIQLNLDNKQELTLPIGEYSVLSDLSFSQENAYLLSTGLYRFPIDSKTDAARIINETDENKTGKYLGIFENFIYVFNPEQRNIFRYDILTDSADVTGIGWIQDKKDLDFESVTSMAIDGSIWLGTNTGQILKYERGEPVGFTPNGLEIAFAGPIKIFTKPDFTQIYILEPAQQRVVVLNKDGTYVREFVHKSLEAGSDLIAREDTQTIYVVAGSLVYELK